MVVFQQCQERNGFIKDFVPQSSCYVSQQYHYFTLLRKRAFVPETSTNVRCNLKVTSGSFSFRRKSLSTPQITWMSWTLLSWGGALPSRRRSFSSFTKRSPPGTLYRPRWAQTQKACSALVWNLCEWSAQKMKMRHRAHLLQAPPLNLSHTLHQQLRDSGRNSWSKILQ